MTHIIDEADPVLTVHRCEDESDHCRGPVEPQTIDGTDVWFSCRQHFAWRLEEFEASDEFRYARSKINPDWLADR